MVNKCEINSCKNDAVDSVKVVMVGPNYKRVGTPSIKVCSVHMTLVNSSKQDCFSIRSIVGNNSNGENS